MISFCCYTDAHSQFYKEVCVSAIFQQNPEVTGVQERSKWNYFNYIRRMYSHTTIPR